MQVSELHMDDNALLPSTEQSMFRWLSKWLGKEVEKTLDLVCLEEEGLPPVLVDKLIDDGFERRDLSWIIPARTLTHRKSRGESLSREESSRLIRFLRLLALAEVVFDNKEKARAWLYRPLKRFNDRRPFDLIQTEQGEELAEEALWQIDEGMLA